MRPPSPCAAQLARGLAARPPDAVLVDLDGAEVVLPRLVREVLDGERDAGVGDGDVEPAERLDRGGDGRRDLLAVAHVAADEPRLPAGGGDGLVGRRPVVEPLAVGRLDEVGADDGTAVARQAQRDGAPVAEEEPVTGRRGSWRALVREASIARPHASRLGNSAASYEGVSRPCAERGTSGALVSRSEATAGGRRERSSTAVMCCGAVIDGGGAALERSAGARGREDAPPRRSRDRRRRGATAAVPPEDPHHPHSPASMGTVTPET